MATLDEIKRVQAIIGATPDGAFGARSVDALVEWMRARGELAPTLVTTDARARVVAEALSHVRVWTEADVDALWREVGRPDFVGHWHDKAWCGGFALRCLRRALGVTWEWAKPTGYGFAEEHGLPKVSLPEPGDVAYYAKGAHHAIVVSAANGRVRIVNGNGMIAPAEGVTVTERPIADAACYYSIGRLG